MSVKFHTKYDLAKRLNENKVYDRHDNVDRLSYVDNALMIKRFVMEGRSLAEARAKALKSGQYSGDLKEIDNDTGVAAPVYAMDPALAAPIIEQVKRMIETSVAERVAKMSNDKPTGSASEVNGSSPNNQVNDVNTV